MSDSLHELIGYLIETARAHHAATGGVNPQWAEWYAARAIDDVNGVISSEMSSEELASWLAEADERYRSEAPDMSWPKAYATWLIEERG